MDSLPPLCSDLCRGEQHETGFQIWNGANRGRRDDGL